MGGGGVRLEPGDVFAGDFRVMAPLAEGGMGVVYVAQRLSTKKTCALKVVFGKRASEEAARASFEREARVGALIANAHVVEVLEAGVDPATDAPWIAMELLEGEDLAALLRRRGWLPADEARSILAQMCDALGAAHAISIVHRDLKPENVFLARASGEAQGAMVVKLLDFGIAAMARDHEPEATRPMGTPAFMAPEQCSAKGPITTATDVWALGLLAFRMLTGHVYWRAPMGREHAAEIVREVAFESLEDASVRAARFGVGGRVPPGFDAWFAKCVVREIGERFATATDAWRALDPVLANAPEEAQPVKSIATLSSREGPPPSTIAPAPASPSTSWMPRLVLLGVAVAAVAVLVYRLARCAVHP